MEASVICDWGMINDTRKVYRIYSLAYWCIIINTVHIWCSFMMYFITDELNLLFFLCQHVFFCPWEWKAYWNLTVVTIVYWNHCSIIALPSLWKTTLTLVIETQCFSTVSVVYLVEYSAFRVADVQLSTIGSDVGHWCIKLVSSAHSRVFSCYHLSSFFRTVLYPRSCLSCPSTTVDLGDLVFYQVI